MGRDNDDGALDIILNMIMVSNDSNISAVISGGASGADTVASNWASVNGIKTSIFKPIYNDFTVKTRRWEAPKARNTTIINNSDLLLAIWDMKSGGTSDSINKALDKGMLVYIYNFNTKKITSSKDGFFTWTKI